MLLVLAFLGELEQFVTWLGEVRDLFWSDPIPVAVAAGLVAIATTPIAFAILGRMDWFQARRGRTYQRPEFWSVVTSMMLVMGVPAIFCGLAIKSRYFDEERYEFDPNTTISVLDQGRRFEMISERRAIEKADEAVRAEMKRLNEERKNLVNAVKKLDESMLMMRAAAAQSPATAQVMPSVLDRLADIRRAVGVDAPQQLFDETAPPVDLPKTVAVATPAPAPVAAPTAAASIPPATSGAGLSPIEADIELATVPEPQRTLASMLPLTDLPPGWVVGESGDKHLETFNAENLYEKIDGRAESFVQFNVRGMAYTYYHPEGDESSEAQIYIFEMADPLKALGKFGSEKPDGVKPIDDIGDEAYTAAGSVFVRAGKYYTQIVTTTDDPKLADFALELARRVAAKQKPAEARTPGGR